VNRVPKPSREPTRPERRRQGRLPGGPRLPGIRPGALPAPGDRDWYRRAVFYEVSSRGFFDANDDGMGDIAGIRAKLDYLEWLGIDCLWLLPYYPSPLRDGGYDISDFFSVHPDLGSLDDLGEFLDEGGFCRYFTTHFALPLVAAVWSCPPGTALSYPARYLFAFLANHGMLSVSGSPPWRTVTGGSRCYVELAAKQLHDIRLSTPVRAVRRHGGGAEVRDAADQTHQFDAVVIATHPDQALRLLDPPTQAERDVLGAFGYTRNPALLHTDVTLLPDRPGIRASWNYELSGCWPGEGGPAPRISYHMNRLQNLPAGEDYIVTLGGQGVVDPAAIIDQMDYAHPAYTPASVAAQRRLPELNTAVTAFAGAYHGWGFHEDGCRSGAEAARALGGIW